jgi:hypothetical protein
LLSFCAESFVFRLTTPKHEIQDTQDCIAAVLYGYEIRSLAFREERTLRVFDSRVLRRKFGPKRDEVTGGGKNYKMRSSVICTAHPNIVRLIKSRRMRWAEHLACMEERNGVYRVLVGKSEGKRPLG